MILGACSCKCRDYHKDKSKISPTGAMKR